MTRSSLTQRLILGLLACSWLHQADARGQQANSQSFWPIPVEKGRASFDLPGRKTLVIVSSLAGKEGPFSLELRASPTDSARPLARQEAVSVRPRPPLVPPAVRVPKTPDAPPQERSFAILVRDGDPASVGNYVTVKGRLLALGKHIQIYVDPNDLGQLDRGLLADLVATFDNRIYPLAARRFGPANDVDGDGRFTIMVSSWLDRLAGGRAKVDGFVRGSDLDINLEPPFGNRCDVMYLNPALQPGPHARTVLAHEYTHAIVFSRKALDHREPRGSIVEEEGWLDEALAHMVEDLHGFSKSNIDYRVSAFLSSPERYRLVVDDYYTANLFRSHGNRGGTYLFLRWLADREGEALIDRLIRSDLKGAANLEAATGRSLADLYREWSVALFVSGIQGEVGDANSAGLYRSIDPRGTIEDWILAGPRASRIAGDGRTQRWSMVGTSSHYAVIEGSQAVATRVEVSGPADAALQITAVRLPDDLGALDLTIHRVRSSTGEHVFRATLQDRGGTPLRVGALCWEPLTPTSETHALRSSLDMLGVASAFGSSALPASGRRTSRTIALGKSGDFDGPLVFKVVGTDAKGRRVAAWAELEVAGEDRAALNP